MATRISLSYELRLLTDEYDWLARRGAPEAALIHWPHIHRALHSRPTLFVLRHIQNFCWTLERASVSLRRLLHPPKPEPRPAPAPKIENDTRETLPIGRRIFFDLTNTHRRGPQGGISRVALMFARECRRTINAIPVVMLDGDIHELGEGWLGEAINIAAGDVFFIIDCFWDPCDEYIAFVERNRPRGLLLATCFYDIVFALHPFVLPDDTRRLLNAALPRMLPLSDIAVSISQSSLEDLVTYAARTIPHAAPHFAAYTLGADFAATTALTVTPQLEHLGAMPLFLSVGTIEPKKGYTTTLDAMDMLWAGGADCSFLIIGRYGWSSNAIADRIKTHPRFGINLFWEERANDALLQEAYRRCYCFIQASVAEGFGIPIIEAANCGLPVVCSDIDVFKEIGGEGLIYFESENAGSLAVRLRQALAERPPAASVPTPTWRESFVGVCALLDRCASDLERRGDEGRRRVG